MERRRTGLATLASLSLLAGCHQAAQPRTTFITMADNTFSPNVMRVPVGAQVQFRNWGGVIHAAASVDGSWSTAKESGKEALRTGEWVGVTFDHPGVYHFYCRFHGTPDGQHGMVGTVIVGDVQYTSDGPKTGQLEPVAEATGVTRRVPEEFSTIQAAVDAAAPGDMVLIAPGVYKEEVIVTTPSVTVRGLDRNTVVLEGEFTRANGITLYANGTVVENLTAQNYTLNGIFITGVTGYRNSYVTTINNGDYGIYAFDSYEGLLDHSLGSGSPDAGFYVGGCYPCKTVLDSVKGNNNIGGGYSGTNSGGDLYIINSEFADNGYGISPNTFDVEPHPPQRETTIIGNRVINNRGSGISIAGGNKNLIERNLVTGNGGYGILVHGARDRNFYPSTGNIIRDNTVLASGKADLGSSGVGNLGNCFEGNRHSTTLPWGLQLAQRCGGVRVSLVGDLNSFFSSIAGRNALFGARDKFGDEWKTWPRPPAEPSMPNAATAPARPALHPTSGYPLELERIVRPNTPATSVVAARGGR